MVSFLLAYFHVPFGPLKSMYMARMILLLLPPAAFGVAMLWERARLPILILIFLSLLSVAYLHSKVSLNRTDWQALKKHAKSSVWYLTSYSSEGAYLPALSTPAWVSHYLVSQLDEFRKAAREKGFDYVVCDRDDPNGPIEYYRRVCTEGPNHPDVKGIAGQGETIIIYRLKKTVHPDFQ